MEKKPTITVSKQDEPVKQVINRLYGDALTSSELEEAASNLLGFLDVLLEISKEKGAENG